MKTLAEIRDEEATKMADIKFDSTAFNPTQVRLINNIAIAYAKQALEEAGERAMLKEGNDPVSFEGLYGPHGMIRVDKDSILNIINELK